MSDVGSDEVVADRPGRTPSDGLKPDTTQQLPQWYPTSWRGPPLEWCDARPYNFASLEPGGPYGLAPWTLAVCESVVPRAGGNKRRATVDTTAGSVVCGQ